MWGSNPRPLAYSPLKRIEGERSNSTELKGQREPFLALINLGDYSLSSFSAYFQINPPDDLVLPDVFAHLIFYL